MSGATVSGDSGLDVLTDRRAAPAAGLDLTALFSMRGRVAFVAGASGAIGQHAAAVLHDAGASVVLAGRRLPALTAAAAALGDRAMAVGVDLAEPELIGAAFDAAAARFGACDVIINAAGVAVTRRAIEQTPQDWDMVMNTNLRGAFLVAQTGARRLVTAGLPGAIVNIASILGSRLMPGVAAYAASKAGLIHLTRALAIELARHGIRANALAPGYIATEMNAAFLASDAGRAMIGRIPQRRAGRLEDLTGALLLLASEAGAHMTGAVITVDGGHTVASL